MSSFLVGFFLLFYLSFFIFILKLKRRIYTFVFDLSSQRVSIHREKLEEMVTSIFQNLIKKCFTVSLWKEEKENLLLSLFPFSSPQYIFPHFYILLFLWYPLCPTSGTCLGFTFFLLNFWFCILIFSFASAILWNNCR